MTSKALPNWIIGVLLFAVFILSGHLAMAKKENRKLKARMEAVAEAKADAAIEKHVAELPLRQDQKLADPFQAYQPPSDVTAAFETPIQLPAEGAAPPDR